MEKTGGEAKKEETHTTWNKHVKHNDEKKGRDEGKDASTPSISHS